MLTARRLATYTHDRPRLTPRQRRRAVHKANRLDAAARKVALAAIAVLVAGCAHGTGHATGPTRSEAGPAPVRYRLATEVVPTTTTTTTLPPRPPTTRARRSVGPQNVRPRQAPGDPWGCIRQYESGGTTDPAGSNDHRDGYYQIIPSTWANEKGGYRASDGKLYPTAQSAPYDIQSERAQQIQQRSGWGQWSTAGRCGLA